MTTDNERLDRLELTVTRHEHAIYGNGTPGLKTQVSILESGKRQTEGTIHMTVAITGVIVAILSMIVAIVATWAGSPAAH